ncbi:hypothetical protein DU500_07430 [Haloplanus rubicundus]|uniref:Uncharacterized protein n=1 Tax=Haloplanus rubicundus TaxID=1547898 RepID=A0A345E258_9EURY|nr:hypothetical protein DU500_07430 [Haloplanus rubicundus]
MGRYIVLGLLPGAVWHADSVVSRHTFAISVLTRSERKPTPSGVGVSDNIPRQSTRYDSSGCSTASRPASIISR